MNQAQRKEPLSYHIYTIWLFTRSDLKTIVIPSTIFGVVSVLTGPMLTTNPSPSILLISKRLPITAFWVWINLLPFAMDNQRQPDSIQEDSENKAWRPLPSKRLTSDQATFLMLASYVGAVLSSLYLGGIGQCVILIGLGHWYNDLKGADSNCIIRNLINACGYICFTSGALDVMSNPAIAFLKPVAYRWLFIIGLVILTTIQSQDLYDQAGDSLRKRRTVPLVIGDTAARCTVAIPLTMWSLFCPAFWQLGIGGFVPSVILGTIVVWRLFSKRTVKADRITFRIYNMWIVSLYVLPLVKKSGCM